jgi:hypothetical protein
MLRYPILLPFIVSIAACAAQGNTGPSGIGPAIQVESGREFGIAVGQEAHLRGTPITIRFRGVSQDSRCPSDVQCVWAGNAVARFTLNAAEGSAIEVTLNTGLEPRSLVFSGYRIRLVGLEPLAKSGSSVPPGDYVATLAAAPAS